MAALPARTRPPCRSLFNPRVTSRRRSAGSAWSGVNSVAPGIGPASLYTPVSGTVRAVNAALGDQPEIINQDPYVKGWLCELENVAPDAANGLMTAAQYRSYLEAP